MSNDSNENFHRLNLSLDKRLINDLDKLIKLSVRYKSRTQIIQGILQDHVDTIKLYNPNLESNKE
jgi:metal-responsive CopG/Arc/MetJ family transcriptional regulator